MLAAWRGRLRMNAPLVPPPVCLATNMYYGKMVTLPNAVFCLALVCSAYGQSRVF